MATTITEIRASAQRLADAHLELVSRAKAAETAISAALKPIYTQHRAGLDAAAEEEAAARAELQNLVDGAPQLFARPRSITVDGVKCGYRKGEDMLDWDDEEAVIRRLRALALVDANPVLIRTVESINVAALAELDGNELRRAGVRRIPGVDQSYISFIDSDVEKMAKAFLADATKRQGDDEAPKKKGKAKIKAGEVA